MDRVRALIRDEIDRERLLEELSQLCPKEGGEIGLLVNLCLRNDDSSSTYALFDAVHDVVWERLNTGHWRSVDVVWRKLYGLVMALKVAVVAQLDANDDDQVGFLIEDLVKMCDVGLLLGAPVLEDVCGRVAAKLSRLYREIDEKPEHDCDVFPVKRAKIDIPTSDKVVAVPTVHELSLEDFIERHMLPESPVLVTGMMDSWPCMEKWSVEHIRRVAGLRTVPVELGSRYTDAAWTQKLMTVKDFVDEHILQKNKVASKTTGYLAQHDFLDQVRELRDDIDIPEYCHAGGDDGGHVDINSWFGPEGTVSPLHTDPKHNVLCQVFGSKYVRLYPRDQTDFLYPYDDQMLFNTSQLDLEDVDVKTFPKFDQARGLECTLNPGEMLYIPPRCWHFVKSLTPSFSLSFWFE